MSEARRVISLVLALVLMIAGFGYLFYLAAFAPVFKGWMIMGSALVGTIGAYWLYEDFINATPNDQV
jgi:polyferredoxin